MLNILVLAAGKAEIENFDGAKVPACLAEINGTTVIELISNKINKIKKATVKFALNAEDVSRYHLDNIVKILVPSSNVAIIPETTGGSGCTALLAACDLDPVLPLLIISANEYVDVDIDVLVDHFVSNGTQAGTVVFKSILPKYSYVRLNKDNFVVEAAQQNPISNVATTGMFWFEKTEIFTNGIKQSIRKGASTNGQFYLAPLFNELILMQMSVGVYRIENGQYYPFKNVHEHDFRK